jgi:hypothetical protein
MAVTFTYGMTALATFTDESTLGHLHCEIGANQIK